MKNIKDIYEGLLADVEDTLKHADKDVKEVLYKQIIEGIVSDDVKQQDKAIEAIKNELEEYDAKSYKSFDKMAKSKASWWIQFKADKKNDPRNDSYKFVLAKQISNRWYVVYINNINKPVYWRCDDFAQLEAYYLFMNTSVYEVPFELDPICDNIYRVMYMR